MLYEDILAAFRGLKVLVIGDAILDEYIHTTVDRVSPEAPVQVARMENKSYTPGGAANVANNLAALGARVTIAGVTGNDANGQLLRDTLKRHGIDIDALMTDNTRPTTTKTRVMAGRHQMLRIDEESAAPVAGKLEDAFIELLKNRLAEYGGIIVSDYMKGLLTERLLKNLISLAKQHDKPVIVGPKGTDFSKYSGADVIIPNMLEAEAACGQPMRGDEDFIAAAGYLIDHVKCRAVLVTRGAEGMSLYEADGKYHHIPTRARDVYDVSGAGDTVLSVFGLARLAGADYLEAASLANTAAGIVVGKVRTATTSAEEISAAIDAEANAYDRKVKSLPQLKAIVAERKKQGKTVVFTNGCFDLLHIGHVKLLDRARRLGDTLVVALNSDSSVKSLKGKERPIISEAERAQIIAALSSVDYVVLFAEATPESLIRELKPDILVKGADYKLDAVVGREIVESYGGRVELVPLVEEKSTSGLIDRIAFGRSIK